MNTIEITNDADLMAPEHTTWTVTVTWPDGASASQQFDNVAEAWNWATAQDVTL